MGVVSGVLQPRSLLSRGTYSTCVLMVLISIFSPAVLQFFSHMHSRVMCLVTSVHIYVFLTFPSDVVTLAL